MNSTSTSDPSSSAGFTLIELLVVASLTVILMLSVTAIFMTSLISNTKIKIEQELKAEGNQALSQMTTLIRNARAINDSCSEGGISHNNLTFTNLDGGTTNLQVDGSQIASHSTFLDGTDSTYFLTSERNNPLTPPPELEFTCYKDNNTYYVDVEFTLQIGLGSEAGRETALETFSSGVTVRN